MDPQTDPRPPAKTILWVALLGSVAMIFLVTWFLPIERVEPERAERLGPVLLAVGVTCVLLSFVMRSRLGANGWIVALALCEAPAPLGLAAWIVTGWDLWWAFFLVAAAGMWAHRPS